MASNRFTLAAATVEDTLIPARTERKFAILTAMALLAVCPLIAPANTPLAKIWHSESTQRDYRVDVSNDVFRAEWVNLPPAAAKQGAYIRTECRRSGAKWVGKSSINMLFGIPNAPPGKDTKLCSITVRFEVDSLTSLKITGHSESLRSFDVKTCRIQQTSWGQFTWVPKK